MKGDVEGAENVLVRVHSECLTGDVFHSLRCDCGEQLEQALARIEAEGRGVLLYMAQEGRGIGLLNKLRAYELQETGLDTVEANLELGFPADAREWGIGNQILADLGLTTIRILTNNPRKLTGLDGYGLTVVEQVPIEVEPTAENARYLAAKREKLGHTITKLHHQGARLEPERAGGRRMSSRDIDDDERERPPRLGARRGGRAGATTRSSEPERAVGDDRRAASRRRRSGVGAAPDEPSRAARTPLRRDAGAGAEADEVEPSDAEDERATAEPARRRSTRRPMHVELSHEHAAGDLHIPDGYAVLEGVAEGGRRAVGVVVVAVQREA